MTSIGQIAGRPEAFANARKNWGWFFALGVMFLTLGAIAAGNLFYSTIAAVLYAGVFMMLAGALQLLHAFRIRSWGGFFLWFASGALYTGAGAATLVNPGFASVILTLLLALLTIMSGASRLVLGWRARQTKAWGWLVASGGVTTVAGLVFLLGWPINSVWLLGLLLTLDLMFQGVMLIGFACQWGTVSTVPDNNFK